MSSNEERALTPGTLIDGARMYAACSDAVANTYPNALHVQSHMLGMSLELTFKAFLRLKGASVQDLRKLGHNLTLAYAQCVDRGLYYTGSRNFVVAVVSALFKERIFAYPQEANMSTIEPRRIREVVDELLNEVFGMVHPDSSLDPKSPGLGILGEYAEECAAGAWAIRDRKS